MYTKRGNVKITKIISDLRDAIVDLKKVVLKMTEVSVETCFANLRVLLFSLKFWLACCLQDQIDKSHKAKLYKPQWTNPHKNNADKPVIRVDG